ncbi:MAG: ABC transporter ATP-binding protein [Bacteroidales bacterium]|jgi:ABC-type multidrug transport system ATPase subunit|nr:ABC transporter ATP-binding protein [Bacteroidales bacterium]MCK9498526.1 ABC transporter ATP-binding protein [Bacteroidales bacterium]MDY0314271.1 ABC transporter ATP-binding protein [Bacteroidales bacterium]NLB86423.1 ABC transporter ATP-binding protein [Bacteroidales bacterium]
MYEIEIHNLCKNFGKTPALDNLNLVVKKNEFYGLIGPDGAGKTTLMRIITSLLLPDSGYLKVAGLDPGKDYRELRLKLGYMPGKFALYQDLSIEENLTFFATVFGTTVKENYNLIKSIYSQIEPFKNRRAGKLSGGMKQKLALSCALVHKPEILILDEPTTGVDAVSRREFWEMLNEIKSHGITIVVSTPYLEEAALCDNIALMNKGKIISSGSPEEISSTFPEDLFIVETKYIPQTLKVLRQFPNLINVNSFGHSLHLVLKKNTVQTKEIVDFIENKGISNIKVKKGKPEIEDSFIYFSSSNL